MNTLIRNWYVFVVLIVEGASLMAVELIGARFFAPFYGNSLYVWTAVLTITVLGLSLGYFVGGKLSQVSQSQKWISYIVGLAGILSFFMPESVSWVIQWSHHLNLIPGIILASLLILFPIIFLFGLVGPLAVSSISDRLSKVGHAVGLTYLISTSCGIVATFIFGLYFIPEYGMMLSAKAVGVALFVVFLLSFVARGHTSPSQHSEQLKENLNPVELNQKESISSNSIFFFAALEGACVMAIELMGARMLAPIYGSSFHVWVVVIGITLLSLAIGYFAGGKLADRSPKRATFYLVLLVAASLVATMHFMARLSIFTTLSLDLSISLVIVSLILLMPPLVCLGMIPTFLIRFLTTHNTLAGKSTGFVFSLSSLSGILSLTLLGFWVIPELGLTYPSILLGLVLGLFPAMYFLKRMEYSGFVFIGIVIFSFSQIVQVNSSERVKVLEYSEGLFGQLMVMEYPNQRNGKPIYERTMFVNRTFQTKIDTALEFPTDYVLYTKGISEFLPKKSKALLLGLGGGIMANELSERFDLDAVELDERIYQVAKTYFRLAPDVNVIIDDARHFIETSENKYDLIVFDLFKGEFQPEHVLTLECFNKAKNLLNENGIIVMNFIGYIEGDNGLLGRSILKTFNETGLNIEILPTPGVEPHRNILFIGSNAQYDLSSTPNPASTADSTLGSYFLNTELYLSQSGIVLVDDQPKINKMNFSVVHMMRTGFTRQTRWFLGEGIPIFQ
ncbi:MAG: fused MFS/spermidine synthase [Flavobacteriales bacterium]|nr:fused MFS/spermidine synthase [Flavobacteriales bacterium]